MSLVTVLILSAVLGGASFLFGLLPLTVSFSRKALVRLSVFGTGLLLGAAIGVIIPEGIETIYDDLSHSPPSSSKTRADEVAHTEPPTFAIAMSLLLGFLFMLLVEQISAQLSPPPTPSLSSARDLRSPYPNGAGGPRSNLRRSNSGLLTPSRPLSPTTATSITDGDLDLDGDIDFDLELSDFEHQRQKATSPEERRRDPRLLTFGLVIHSLADGLALGASLSSGASGATTEEGSYGFGGLSSLSLVVFVALALHKAPASLALTSTLMTQLPSRIVRTHLAVFSLAAPLSAVFTYLVLAWFGGLGAEHTGWTGRVLLFSSGTFLYVATLLSPISTHAHAGEASSASTATDAHLTPWQRFAVIATGMLAPALLAGAVGHGH